MSDSLNLIDTFLSGIYYNSNIVVWNCRCYTVYQKKDSFKNLIENKKSYTACGIAKEGHINHFVIPVCIGSGLDFHIRGSEAVEENYAQFGFFILRGGFVNYPAFWSNSTSGLCTIKNKKSDKMSVAWTLYDDFKNYVMKYSTVFECFKIDLKTKTKQDSDISEFMEILNKERSVISLPPCTKKDLEFHCLQLINHPLNMDSLANKVIITAHEIINRVYRSLVFSDSPGKDNLKSIQNTFENGVVFFALQSKIRTGIEFDCSSNNNKPISNNVSGSKQDSSMLTTRMIKRRTTVQMKKSNALKYPHDGDFFLCPVNSKELEGAGEQVELAVLTVVSVPVKKTAIIKFLVEMSDQETEEKKYRVAIEDYITTFQMTKKSLIDLKKTFPMVSVIIYGDVIKIQTQGGIPLKFCCFYELFISPFEKQFIWTDAFKYYNAYAKYDMSSQLSLEITKMPPGKINVSRINLKNSAAQFTKKQIEEKTPNFIIFSKSGGNHSAILKDSVDYDNVCRVDRSPHKATEKQLDFVQKSMDKTKEILQETGFKEPDLFKKMAPLKMRDFLMLLDFEKIPKGKESAHQLVERWFKKMRTLLIQGKMPVGGFLHTDSFSKVSPEKFLKNLDGQRDLILFKKKKRVHVSTEEKPVKKRKIEAKFRLKDLPLSLSSVNWKKIHDTRTNNLFHDFVFTAFGDIGGGTVEDGIILDTDYVKNAPLRLNSVQYKIDLKRADNIQFQSNLMNNKIFYHPQNIRVDNEIIFGYITSCIRLTFGSNEMVKITETNMKGSYIYCVSCTFRLDDDAQIDINSEEGDGVIFVSYSFYEKIGIGTKISNLFGQKNVVSKIKDLKHFVGVQPNGLLVKPAILYPIQSLYGRFAASQITSALKFKNCAFQLNSPDGMPRILSPTLICFHEISSLCKMHTFKPNMRADLWLGNLGFDGNMLNGVRSIICSGQEMEKKNRSEESTDVIFSRLFPLDGTMIQFLETISTLETEDST